MSEIIIKLVDVCNESILVTYSTVLSHCYNCAFPNCLSLPYLSNYAGDNIRVTSQEWLEYCHQHTEPTWWIRERAVSPWIMLLPGNDISPGVLRCYDDEWTYTVITGPTGWIREKVVSPWILLLLGNAVSPGTVSPGVLRCFANEWTYTENTGPIGLTREEAVSPWLLLLLGNACCLRLGFTAYGSS